MYLKDLSKIQDTIIFLIIWKKKKKNKTKQNKTKRKCIFDPNIKNKKLKKKCIIQNVM